MSSWQEKSNRRKEFRQAKEEQRERPDISKKDTKKWCGGKVGREHKLKCFLYFDELSVDKNSQLNRWRALICIECGKRLDSWLGNNKFKPDWVDN